MKKATRNRWDEHCPATNCLWMHYLADIIVTAKHHCLNREHKALLRSFRFACNLSDIFQQIKHRWSFDLHMGG